MTAVPYRPLVLAPLLLLYGCGRVSRTEPASEMPAAPPLALVVEREISGRVLGETLNRPSGLVVDRRGVLYLSDEGNNRIISFDTDLNPQKEIGGYGSQPGSFDQPGFLVVDNDLNLLVSDRGNKRLARYNGKLNYVDEITLVDEEDPLKYGMASGVAVNEYGEVWVCDAENNRVAVFDNVGQFSRFIGEFGYSGGQLSAPEKILYNGRDRFYVCDAGNRRVITYDHYGNYFHEIADRSFEYPVAITIAPGGYVWVVDKATGRLFCFSGTRARLLETGPLLPGTDRPLRSPSDIAALPSGRLTICDAGNHRVLICRVVFEQP